MDNETPKTGLIDGELSNLRIENRNDDQIHEIPEKSAVANDEKKTEEFEKPSDKVSFDKESYKCRFCGLSYVYFTTLKAHERVHNVEAPYTCTKCGDAFRFYSELEYHMMGHTGQKVYKCQCGRGFYRYTDLLYHKHPGEDDDLEQEGAFKPQHPLKVYAEESRPYICQYCSKAYTNSRDLKFHIYSHRGERAFNVQASRYLMSRSDYR